MARRLIPGAGDARRLAMPRTAARQARDNPAPTIVLILIALVAVNGIRTGQPIPTLEQGFAWIGAALAFIVVAQVAPDLVTYSLLLMLLYVFLVNYPLIEGIVRDFTARLALGRGDTPLPGQPVGGR